MNLREIANDASLYGHALTSFPDKIVSFARHSPTLYKRPDPDTVVVNRSFSWIARTISFEHKDSDGKIYQSHNSFEFFFTPFLGAIIEGIELFVRQVLLGIGGFALSYAVLLPIGFSIKVIHLGIRFISQQLSTAFDGKIANIWNDPKLFGHALTSAPLKAYRFTISAPSWHLREDGTEKGSDVVGGGVIDGVLVEINHHPGILTQLFFTLVPVAFIERVLRMSIGIPVTLASSAISPLGFAIKSVHFALRALE